MQDGASVGKGSPSPSSSGAKASGSHRSRKNSKKKSGPSKRQASNKRKKKTTKKARPGSASATAQTPERRISSWKRQHAKVPKKLFHYTNVEGVMGIVESKSLWASNAAFMSDPSEMRYAADLLRDAFAKRASFR